MPDEPPPCRCLWKHPQLRLFGPIFAQQLSLRQDGLRCLLLFVGRLAVTAQDALHQRPQPGVGALLDYPVDLPPC